ncbi:hypothetical protein UJ101_01585 [Flavobacteriaceae bacterium UJ101]|nr:hypothetical protein UJ101_01585 [Flavobacteriaceae bacterium UJ101]
MKKLLLLTFILIFSFLKAQDTITELYDSKWEKVKNPKDMVYFRTAYPIEKGKWKAIDFYHTGSVQMIGFYNTREMKDLQGLIRYYHSNGVLSSKGVYKNDKRIGTWFCYDKEGKLIWKGKYENGERSGNWEFYYPSGKLWGKGEYSKGKEENNWEYFHETGERSATILFKEGKEIKEEYFNKEGNLVSKKRAHTVKEDEIKNKIKRNVFNKLQYPPSLVANRIEGVVIVNFKLNSSGKISGAKIFRSSGYKDFNEEALRAVEKSGFSKEIKIRNRLMDMDLTIPIKFSLN